MEDIGELYSSHWFTSNYWVEDHSPFSCRVNDGVVCKSNGDTIRFVRGEPVSVGHHMRCGACVCIPVAVNRWSSRARSARRCTSSYLDDSSGLLVALSLVVLLLCMAGDFVSVILSFSMKVALADGFEVALQSTEVANWGRRREGGV